MKKDVITYPIEGDPMAPSDGIKIVLKRSPEDPPQFSREYQADMGKVFTALHNEGTKFEATAFAMDAVDAVGGATGEILAQAKVFLRIVGPRPVEDEAAPCPKLFRLERSPDGSTRLDEMTGAGFLGCHPYWPGRQKGN